MENMSNYHIIYGQIYECDDYNDNSNTFFINTDTNQYERMIKKEIKLYWNCIFMI